MRGGGSQLRAVAARQVAQGRRDEGGGSAPEGDEGGAVAAGCGEVG